MIISRIDNSKLIALTVCFCLCVALIAWIYDLGYKAGQMGALRSAYEVCRKVAPRK